MIAFERVSRHAREYRVLLDGIRVGYVLTNGGKWWTALAAEQDRAAFHEVRGRFRTRKAAAERLVEQVRRAS